MATIEDVLVKETYKQDGLDVCRRVFYTLTAEKDIPNRDKLQEHRNSKAIALLFKALCDTGQLTDKQLDDILLDVVR
jgi:hypothetical protein